MGKFAVGCVTRAKIQENGRFCAAELEKASTLVDLKQIYGGNGEELLPRQASFANEQYFFSKFKAKLLNTLSNFAFLIEYFNFKGTQCLNFVKT